MSALDLAAITKSFGRLQTLKGIDLTLERGEFLVLLGASGCGKSTLLNIIAGLVPPTSGSVRIEGRDVTGVAPKNRDIAMVFQSYALYPNLSVARNIGFGLEMRGTPRAEREAAVRRVAEILRIDALLDRKPADLSGGQRQRVAIGRAMVRNPRLFLFDEPLSNLDAKLRLEMRGELKRLHQMLGATIVYVTHDQIEAMTLATRIAVMNAGAIEQVGPPEEIYSRPASRFVAEFVGSPPMNLIAARRSGSELWVAGVDRPLPLPAVGADLPEHLLVGIRPEALRLAREGEPGIAVRVEMVELTGPEKVISARIGGQPITACVPPASAISAGTEVTLGLEPESLHLFDPGSGRRL